MKERMPATRVLVTGSREWTDRARLERELLDELVTEAHQWGVQIRCGSDPTPYLKHHERKYWVHFILGDCKTGADFMAHKWCEEHELSFEVHRITDGRQYTERFATELMHARNQRMVDEGRPERFVAFWDGRRKPSGTCDTMSRCTIAGVSGRVVPWNLHWKQPTLRLGSEPPR